MPETKHIYVVPRWGGTSRDDWYPWLKRELEAHISPAGVSYKVHLLEMPAWDLPVIDVAIDHLTKVLPAHQLDHNTILVGHSVSCLAILHYLAKVGAVSPRLPQVGGVVCVAGWFSVDSPWQEVLNWIHAPIDFEAARRLIPRDKLVVLLSDDDPYTSGYQENKRLWVERLRSQVHILPGRQHFSSQLDSDILDAIKDLAAEEGQPIAANKLH
jgi:predicted alpha/beta hydrolase family esterase